MKKSRVFTLCLACFLTAVTTFGTLVATTGGGRFLANLNDKSSINTEDSLSFKTGLNPETDPIVYTTDYGLEIHYANDFKNSRLAGFTYFTMAKYQNIPINWVIIGYDPSLSDLVGDYTGEVNRNPTEGEKVQTSTVDSSPAGMAILKDMFVISSSATEEKEIGEGCVLCLSEYSLYKTQFHTSSLSVAIYKGTHLESEMENLYNTLFSDEQKALIIKQTIFTNSYNGLTESEGHLFPFGAHAKSYGENFRIEDYLEKNQVATELITAPTSNYNTLKYWCRSGNIEYTNYKHYAHVAEFYAPAGTGAWGGNTWVTDEHYVRPAFVFEIL